MCSDDIEPMLFVGKKFDSYVELQTCMEHYKSSNFVNIVKKSSSTVTLNNLRAAKLNSTVAGFKHRNGKPLRRILNECLVYEGITYQCTSGGMNTKRKTDEPEHHPVKKRVRMPTRTGCPFMLRLVAETDCLVVTKFVEDHNHPISKTDFEKSCQQRRLTPSQLEIVKSLFTEKNMSVAKVRAFCHENFNKLVTRRDLSNLNSKLNQSEHKMTQEDLVRSVINYKGGKYVDLFYDDDKTLSGLFFQSHAMFQILKSYPQILMLNVIEYDRKRDGENTEQQENNVMSVSTLMIIDSNGQCQIVAFWMNKLMRFGQKSDKMTHNRKMLKLFKSRLFSDEHHESTLSSIRCVVCDEEWSESGAMRCEFPNANVIISPFNTMRSLRNDLDKFFSPSTENEEDTKTHIELRTESECMNDEEFDDDNDTSNNKQKGKSRKLSEFKSSYSKRASMLRILLDMLDCKSLKAYEHFKCRLKAEESPGDGFYRHFLSHWDSKKSDWLPALRMDMRNDVGKQAVDLICTGDVATGSWKSNVKEVFSQLRTVVRRYCSTTSLFKKFVECVESINRKVDDNAQNMFSSTNECFGMKGISSINPLLILNPSSNREDSSSRLSREPLTPFALHFIKYEYAKSKHLHVQATDYYDRFIVDGRHTVSCSSDSSCSCDCQFTSTLSLPCRHLLAILKRCERLEDVRMFSSMIWYNQYYHQHQTLISRKEQQNPQFINIENQNQSHTMNHSFPHSPPSPSQQQVQIQPPIVTEYSNASNSDDDLHGGRIGSYSSSDNIEASNSSCSSMLSESDRRSMAFRICENLAKAMTGGSRDGGIQTCSDDKFFQTLSLIDRISSMIISNTSFIVTKVNDEMNNSEDSNVRARKSTSSTVTSSLPSPRIMKCENSSQTSLYDYHHSITYNSNSSGGGGGAECTRSGEEIQVSEEIELFYDPSTPNVVKTVEPVVVKEDEMIPIVILPQKSQISASKPFGGRRSRVTDNVVISKIRTTKMKC